MEYNWHYSLTPWYYVLHYSAPLFIILKRVMCKTIKVKKIPAYFLLQVFIDSAKGLTD